MKHFYIAFIVSLLFSCNNKKKSNVNVPTHRINNEIKTPEFQNILDSVGVHGAILIYDSEDNSYYSNDFDWAKTGRLPASTFKIANSIIALETSVIENDSTVIQWNGEDRWLDIWEQDLAFSDAFQYSCVPCYQEVACNIGTNRMIEYLNKLEYGEMDIDSSNIDRFWLEGDSRISQFQQIDFLKRLYRSNLPITDRTESIMKRIMVIEINDDYKLSGKTGWSIRNEYNNGWFVGYIESRDNTYFFATNVEPKPEFDMDRFSMMRKEVTLLAIKKMKLAN